MEKKRPKVGLGVIIKKDGKVLVGKRKGSHGQGTWSFSGGHLEFGETLEKCACREVLEETGICIKNIKGAAFTNDFFENEQKHYVTIFVTAEYASGDVSVLEPDKCEKWEWFDWNSLPQPLFLPIVNLIKQGYNLF